MNKIFRKIQKNWLSTLLIGIGALSWVLTMIKNGLPITTGIGFWGANGHDGIWHIALANTLSRGSFEMPVFAGAQLQNYHIGFDLALALLSRISTIPVSVWYFQIIPPFLAISVGILSYVFVKEWSKSRTAALWSTFFVYFGGSFGYVVTLFRGEGISGESLFWSQQSISTLINPPFALSLIVLMSGLLVLSKSVKTKSNKNYIAAIVLFSLLLSIKAYAGVLVLGALVVQSLYEYIQSRSLKTVKLLVPVIVFSLVLFLPLNRSAGQLIFFQPGWFLETMLALSDRFYWPKLFEAIVNWRAAHIYYKAFAGYGVAFIIFIIGNFGTRILLLFSLKNINPKKMNLFNYSGVTIFLMSVAGGGLAASMLFLQTGTAWNTIQFFYYTLFISALFAGPAVESLLQTVKSQRIKVISTAFIVLLTIPTSLSTLMLVYLPGRPPAQIPAGELDALSFLRTQPAGTVLTYPYDPLLAKAAIENPPRPLYLYDSTAYVAAYGNHEVFLEDEVNLTIMNYQWKTRRKAIDEFYASTDQKRVYNFIRENKISYIYWVKPQFTQIGDLQLRLQNIFENKTVIIYKVL